MKKGVLFAFLLLTGISFVSAQGLSELLNSIDQSTILLFAVFIISFSLLFFALNKVFKKENTTISGIISVAISLLIIYGINKSGFDVQGSLQGIGISAQALGIIIPLVIAAGIIFLIIKLKKKKDILLILGVLSILLSFFVYEKILLITVGVVMIIIRVALDSGILRGESHAEAVRRNYNAGAGI